LTLAVPPLRTRPDDIPDLARDLLCHISADLGRPGMGLSRDAEARLCAYGWPGNVRELRNVLERAALLSDRALLGPADLLFAAERPPATEDESGLTMVEVERRHLQRVLDRHQGRVVEAARNLGIPRSSLYQKIQKFGLTRKLTH
jgi:DNA-binding NtrC family response regulator